MQEGVDKEDGSADDEAPVREKFLIGPRLDLVAIELTADENSEHKTQKLSSIRQCERATYIHCLLQTQAPRAYIDHSLVVEGEADQEQEPASDRENHDGNGEL